MEKPLDIVKAYYTRIDAGRQDVIDLFDDQVEFYFPKFGVGNGKAAFGELAMGMMSVLKAIRHDQTKMRFFEAGDTIIVEGVTEGETKDGAVWAGGTTPGGRFTSIFDFAGGLIKRMYIYIDPDYAGADHDRFYWGNERRW